jgi:cell division protein FtsL
LLTAKESIFMPTKLATDMTELLNRAESETKPKQVVAKSARTVSIAPPNPYGGSPQATAAARRARDTHAADRNKPAAPPRKRRSTFNIVKWLFIVAIAIVFYISNALTVNRLMVEVHQLHAQYERIQNANVLLQSEVNRKAARERIGSAAMRQGLVHGTQKPIALDVDEDKLEEFKDK